MRNSPCYKCEKRKVTADYNCHTDCPDYAEYRREIDEMKKARNDCVYVNYINQFGRKEEEKEK